MTAREFRNSAASGGTVRVDDPKRGQIEIVPLVYEVVDDYSTIWTRGVFDKSIERRKPVYAFNHDDSEPIGHMVDAGYRDGDPGPTMIFQLDITRDERGAPLVPRAVQVFHQIETGTLTDHSVGFRRVEWEAESRAGKTVDRFRVCDLDEVSSVMRGAVPGTKTLATRSGRLVSRSTVAVLMGLIKQGKLTEADALAALASDELAQEIVTEAATAEPAEGVAPPPVATVPDDDPIFAEIDALLVTRAARL